MISGLLGADESGVRRWLTNDRVVGDGGCQMVGSQCSLTQNVSPPYAVLDVPSMGKSLRMYDTGTSPSACRCAVASELTPAPQLCRWGWNSSPGLTHALCKDWNSWWTDPSDLYHSVLLGVNHYPFDSVDSPENKILYQI